MYHQFLIACVSFQQNADTPAPAEEKRLATWGTDVPDDLVLDQKKLDEALKKVTFYYFFFNFLFPFEYSFLI